MPDWTVFARRAILGYLVPRLGRSLAFIRVFVKSKATTPEAATEKANERTTQPVKNDLEECAIFGMGTEATGE